MLAIALALAPVWAVAAGLAPVEGPRFIIDLRYAGDDNFLARDIYGPLGLDRCYVHASMLRALEKAATALKASGLRLVLWDCYRPRQAQQAMWELMPDARYVADPKKGSPHNRGVGVDVTLADVHGRRVPMPTDFDDFSPMAASARPCGPGEREKCRHRDLLRGVMTGAGFVAIPGEWWHFHLPRPERYPIVDPAETVPRSLKMIK